MATIKKVERKNGEKSYQISFVHPKTKKWTSKTVRCSYKDALIIKAEIEKDVAYGNIGKDTPDQRDYYWSLLTKRYIDYSKLHKSSKTVKREELVFRTFNKYLTKDRSLADIRTSLIEKYKDVRLESEVRPATVAIELRVLKATFNQAIKWELIEVNPVNGVKIPQTGIIKVRFLHKEEVEKLINVIEDDGNTEFLDLVRMYLNTGARRIELLSPQFTWENVNFQEKKILIYGKGSRKRYIPMNSTVFEILDRRFNDSLEAPFSYKPDYVSHKIADYYKIINIKGANLHSLRKTFGSTLLQNNIADLFTVSKLLGHSSVSTTEKYYVDLIDDNYRSSVEGLENVY